MRFIDTLTSRNGKVINLNKIDADVTDLAKRLKLSLMYLYGSYASGKAFSLSDLDIAFLANKKFSSGQRLNFMDRLAEIFKEEAIDLVDLRNAPLTLIHRILKEGKCLYARSLSEKIEFETKNEGLYFDAAPIRREYEHALLRRIENGAFGHR